MKMQTWQFAVCAGVDGSNTVVCFLGARLNSRGKWENNPAKLPAYVSQYFNIEKKDGSSPIMADFKNLAELLAVQNEDLTWQKCNVEGEAKGIVKIKADPAVLTVLPEMKDKVAKLEAALKAMNEGRNESCWPLVSFGWKDADLDPEGCTGIKAIVGADRKTVSLTAGGHKTVCDPTYESEYNLSKKDAEMYSMVAHSIVCDGPSGEWSGDDWSLSDSTTITVNWRGTIKETAGAIIKKAQKAVRSFEESCQMVDKAMDTLYAEIREKYETKVTA